jgi:hypothetical protein
VFTLYALLAQAGNGGSGLPDWWEAGLAVVIIIATFWLKIMFPGWIYNERVSEKNDQIREQTETIRQKDAEIARLRDLAENKTIPLVERALSIIERLERRSPRESKT